MDINRLHEILRETTHPFRKGAEVIEHDVGKVHVTEIYDMPHEAEHSSPTLIKIDCHFITVGVDTVKAAFHKREFINLLRDYPQPERLADGPSYIEVGGVIGDQQAAFQMFALGESLDLWKVITPKTLGVEGVEADKMAGAGYVMMSGWKDEGE